MLYFATHAFRESAPNPSHTVEGLCQLVSTVVLGAIHKIRIDPSLGINIVFCGTGKRFGETYIAVNTELQGLKVIKSPYFGTGDSKVDGVGVMLSNGDMIPDINYLGISDANGVNWWRFLKMSVPDKALIITGREFCKCLGFRSKMCSIYVVNPVKKQVFCIVEAGSPAAFCIK